MTNELHSPKLGIYFEEVPILEGGPIVWRLTRFPTPGSPADRCGLECLDHISEIDSKTFRSLSHLELISDPNYKSGDTGASFRIRAAESLRGNVKIKVFDCRTGVLNELAIDLP